MKPGKHMPIGGYLTAWFPLFIFVAAMMMPVGMGMLNIPMISIPLLVSVWLFIAVFNDDLNFPRLIVYVVLALFVAQIFLEFTGMVGKPDAMHLGLTWIILGLGVWALMFKLKNNLIIIYQIYLGTALLWLILGLIVWFGWTENGSPLNIFNIISLTNHMSSRIVGPFFNGNVFSILMLCAWCISSGLMFNVKKWQWIYGIISFIFLTIMFAGMSRGTWLSWFIVTVVLLISLLKNKEKRFILWLLLSTLFAWICADMLVSLVLTSEYIQERTSQLLSSNLRITLYASVFEIWKENWLLGVGFGNLSAHYLTGQVEALAYLPETLPTVENTRNAHNHLLQVLAEAGVVGLIVWVSVSVALLRGFWRCKFNIKSWAWWSFAVAFILWFQGLFNVSMIEPVPFFLFCISLGLGMAFQQTEEPKHYIKISKRYLKPILAILSIVLCLQTVVLIKNWTLFDDMYTNNIISSEKRGEKIKKLLGYDNTYPYLILQISNDIMSDGADPKRLIAIQPYIKRALSMEELPGLYQALFYSYALQENWSDACAIVVFIRKNRWEGDVNKEAYQSACRGEEVKQFTIGW